MTLENCLKEGENILQSNNIRDFEYDAYALLEHVTGISRTDFFLRKCDEISEDVYKRYIELIYERAKRIPLQHITGVQNFFGYDFCVNENVLVPRQDTETLVEKVLEAVDEDRTNHAISDNDIRILDMCTGSGCIAITLYIELIKRGINIDVTAVDISSEALKVTQKNASSLIEGLDDDNNTFHIIESDLFSNISKDKKFDIIVSNPPYIPTLDIEKLEDEVRLYDPVMALDGDMDGLKFYRAIIDKSLDYIKPTGLLAFEMGFDQGDAVSKLMEEKGYTDIHIYKDLGGLDRVIIGRNH